MAQATVAKYMPTTRKPPSQIWRTFLANHVPDIAAIDFFTAPTLTFGVLYGFVILRHEQRRVVHVNMTQHPTAQWTAQQIVEAFPFDEAPRFLLRDRHPTPRGSQQAQGGNKTQQPFDSRQVD